jgi:AraC-like DNA-binding protein
MTEHGAAETRNTFKETAYFEHISIPPGQTFLWRLDDYPWRRIVWNYHPEIELHYIRHSSGLAYVGDHIGNFDAGQLVLVGSGLPHNWITPFLGESILPERDIVVQFDPARIARAAAEFPEITELESLFRDAAYGLEFFGETSIRAAARLEAMRTQRGLSALSSLLDLLADLATSTEYRKLASAQFVDQFRPGSDSDRQRLDLALDFIQRNFHERPSCEDVAAVVGMSESAFSRFFKAQTGNTYSDHLSTLRIWTARQKLAETDLPVTDVCFEAGFNNISNFNRTFLRVAGMTPSQYRRAARQRRSATSGTTS